MTAELADGRQLQFPDGTDPAVIQAAVKKVLASTPKETPDASPSVRNLTGAAIEPNIQMLTGMLATPMAGLAGLATAGGNAAGLTDADPAAMVRKIQSTFTYQPRSTGGKIASEAVGYLPGKLGEFANYAGENASDKSGSPAIGAIVDTILQVAPGLLGLKGSSTVADAAGGASTRLMQSALKPGTKAVQNGSADRAIKTLLDEGINVTPGGASKLSDRISGINDDIAQAIQNSGSSATVDKYAAANRVQDFISKIEKQANPNADVAAATKAYDEFTQNHPLIPGNDIPVQVAQEIKQGTYKQLKDKYGEMGSADTEAQKAIARGLKEEIAAKVPEVGPLNAQESELLNAKNLLDRRVAVAGNKNPIGITHLSQSPLSVISGLMDRSELVKSLLARMMNPGDLSLSDMTAAGTTAPQTFSDDMQKRQAIIAALLGGKS